MPRILAFWIAFTTAGAMFALVMLLVAVVLGAPGSASGAQSSPAPSTAPPAGPVGTIEVRASDLGFEPVMVHVQAPGTYAVSFVNDGGTFHDVTFDDGMVSALVVQEQRQ